MKTIYKVAMLSTPICIAVGSAGVYLAVSLQDNDIVTHKDNASVLSIDNLYDYYDIFPDLDQKDFYDSIKIKDGNATIDKDMIAKVLNYIFDHMQKAEGDVGYYTKDVPEENGVDIYVKWEASSGVYWHKYELRLKKMLSQ